MLYNRLPKKEETVPEGEKKKTKIELGADGQVVKSNGIVAVLKDWSLLGVKIMARKKYKLIRHAVKRNEEHALDAFSLALHAYRESGSYAQGAESNSVSERSQDVFVLLEKSFKRNGYFVEMGAADGMCGSNTLLLEEEFGWTGLLVEPAKVWHEALRNCARNVTIDYDCVWSESNLKVMFNETKVPVSSTIDQFSNDHLSSTRKSAEKYQVNTISLQDLLNKHNAPEMVDYLSLDTEGSEYEILKSYDFGSRRIDIITCEHRFAREKRETIHQLLTKNNYMRKFVGISGMDDWYVHTDAGKEEE